MNSKILFSNGLYRLRKSIKQSNLLILSDKREAIKTALKSIIKDREHLENYIIDHPEYKTSLEPVKVNDSAPEIIKLAAFAAEVASVGPMAAIPGALAELAVREMVNHGSYVNLVENGGEIHSISYRPVNVAIYAGSSPISGRIGFHLTPEDSPIGIATSSATVSSALSFGEADAVVIVTDSSSLSDAMATAVCNNVKGSDIESSVQLGLDIAKKLNCVRGAIIIRGNYIGKFGRLPKLIKIKGKIDDIFTSSLQDILPGNIK